jgi:excisionase family DNA binding protein
MPLKAPKRLLTIKEVAEILRINPVTLYRMAQNNAIPALKINSNWRFRSDSIDKWLKDKENGNGKDHCQ